MRKNIILPALRTALLSAVYGVALLSCNNSGEKKEAPDTAKIVTEDTASHSMDLKCTTIGNFAIDPGVAKGLIDRFSAHYKKPGMDTSFWIDSCVISGFQKFLEKNSGYDGVRFYSMVVGNGANRKTDIMMVPTKPSPGPEKHKADWTTPVGVDAKCNPHFKNYNKVFAKEREDFKIMHRREGTSAVNDSLSSGIWFSACVFDALMVYLGDKEHGLDGIRIYCIGYDKYYPNTGQEKEYQSSFVIVVTKPVGNGHEDQWHILKNNLKRDKKFNGDGYNHGELCPKICD
jgi:hypothetical protein